MRTIFPALFALVVAAAPVRVAAEIPGADAAHQAFADWMAKNHVPGLVWGVVKDGRLAHVEALGLADVETKRAVTVDTAFRIASMSKAFTARAALGLVQQGKLGLTDRVARHVPEMRGWAGGITVGDLMHHTAGFVTDDPWGDRQQPLAEAAFTDMLRQGVPFQRAPATGYEYSNFGYATLGRVVTNVSGRNFADEVVATVFRPLGMTATGYEVADVPENRLALPWRWQEVNGQGGRWIPEPQMRAGAFGAMGGVVTTAPDYAKWLAWLLSGWPAEAGVDAPDSLQRAMLYGGGFVHSRVRPGADGAECRQQSLIYAAGLLVGRDCVLGQVAFHSGGYPGYGSHMLLLPEAGVALFAFANRTYAGPSAPVWDVAGQLQKAGFIAARPVPLSAALGQGYDTARRIWDERSVVGAKDRLAMNFLLDANEAQWAKTLEGLHDQLGQCDTSAPIAPDGALSGRFAWRCARGTLSGQLLLAPAHETQIQALRMSAR